MILEMQINTVEPSKNREVRATPCPTHVLPVEILLLTLQLALNILGSTPTYSTNQPQVQPTTDCVVL